MFATFLQSLYNFLLLIVYLDFDPVNSKTEHHGASG
jgi:hypothetical protein